MDKLIYILILITIFFCIGKDIFSNTSTQNPTPQYTQEYIQKTISKTNKKKLNYKIKNQNQEINNIKIEIQNNRDAINKIFPSNYIDRTLENGYLIHWNPETFPLKVYVENNPELPDYFYENVKAAFDEWQNKTDNLINFVFTENIENADIKCTFPKDFYKEYNEDNKVYVAGRTNLNYDKNKIHNASITFASTDSNNIYTPQRKFYLIAIHEIGHVLGILGHSQNEQDIMFPVSNHYQEISAGDINTIKLLYSIVPDISNKPYTEVQRKKYITSEDIMGEYKNRIDIELQNITDDLNIEGSAFSGKYLEKGNLYLKKQNYNLAIKYYKKGLTTIEDKNTKANIYKKIAYCYSKINNFDNAINFMQTSQSIKPNNENIVYIANLYYEQGNLPQARNMMINLIEKDPKIFNSYKLLGKIYYETKNWEKLDELFEKGKLNFPDNPPLKKK